MNEKTSKRHNSEVIPILQKELDKLKKDRRQKMTTKVMKLNELKALVRAWKKEKSFTLSYDICEFLVNNLNLEDRNEA